MALQGFLPLTIPLTHLSSNLPGHLLALPVSVCSVKYPSPLSVWDETELVCDPKEKPSPFPPSQWILSPPAHLCPSLGLRREFHL